MIPYGIARYIITKSELEKFKIEVWNEAIENAALKCCTICKAAENIKRLKK